MLLHSLTFFLGSIGQDLVVTKRVEVWENVGKGEEEGEMCGEKKKTLWKGNTVGQAQKKKHTHTHTQMRVSLLRETGKGCNAK